MHAARNWHPKRHKCKWSWIGSFGAQTDKKHKNHANSMKAINFLLKIAETHRKWKKNTKEDENHINSQKNFENHYNLALIRSKLLETCVQLACNLRATCVHLRATCVQLACNLRATCVQAPSNTKSGILKKKRPQYTNSVSFHRFIEDPSNLLQNN